MRATWLYCVLMVAFSVFGAGCSAQREPPIDKNILAEVLVELHLVRARAIFAADAPTVGSDSVLAVYGVTEEDFRSSMSYYANRPDEYVALMDTVVDRMRVLRPELADDLDESAYAYRYRSFTPDTTTFPE